MRPAPTDFMDSVTEYRAPDEAVSRNRSGLPVTERAGAPIHEALASNRKSLTSWRKRLDAVGGPGKPAVQSLYIDLLEDSDAPPQAIHLGFRSGAKYLRGYLKSLQEIGIHHVALNLRFNQADIETTLKRLANELLPDCTG